MKIIKNILRGYFIFLCIVALILILFPPEGVDPSTSIPMFIFFAIIVFFLFKPTKKEKLEKANNINTYIEDVSKQETIPITNDIKINTIQQEVPKEILNSIETSSLTESPIPPIIKDVSKQETIPTTDTIKVNIIQQEIPKEVLNSMKTSYTGQQAINDMRIIDESLAIMTKTSDIDTFLSRYDTAMRCVLTLEQAKKSGVPIALSDDFAQSLTDAKNQGLKGVLYRSFKKELDEINKLKTEQGKLNRINKYEEKLKEMYEDVFEFVEENAYNDVIQKLEFLKNG